MGVTRILTHVRRSMRQTLTQQFELLDEENNQLRRRIRRLEQLVTSMRSSLHKHDQVRLLESLSNVAEDAQALAREADQPQTRIA